MYEPDEIRRIWVYEKDKFDDSLPWIFDEGPGEAPTTHELDDDFLRLEDWAILRDLRATTRGFSTRRWAVAQE